MLIRRILQQGPEGDWSPLDGERPAPEVVKSVAATTSVAGNVSSFLSGIRASFRQENVNVSTRVHQRNVSTNKVNTNDGKQL